MISKLKDQNISPQRNLSNKPGIVYYK